MGRGRNFKLQASNPRENSNSKLRNSGSTARVFGTALLLAGIILIQKR
jgi:hypothetical protein